MKKIGFFLDSKDFSNSLDFFDLELGNPGIGGTSYYTLLLASKLAELDTINIYLFVTKKISYNKNVIQIKNDDFLESHKSAFDHNIDLFIFNDFQINIKSIEQIDFLNLNCAVWTHTYFSSVIAEQISESKNILLNIFVGNQQYDYYLDHKIIRKSIVIRNGVVISHAREREYNENVVTYLGALYYSKYFHVLAKSWKSVLKRVPDAKLLVIGSGDIYSNKHKLGKLGVADPIYEELFLKYLLDENGEILKSVEFLGKLGPEKSQYLIRTKLGVVNPTGITECLPLSVLEFYLHGVPIVTKNAWGYPDVVINNKTGLLYRNEKRLANYIVKMLENDELNKKHGQNAMNYVTRYYDLNYVVDEWSNMFTSIGNDFVYSVRRARPPYFNQFKFLKVIKLLMFNRFGIVTPSLIEIEEKLKQKIKFSNNIFARGVVYFHKIVKP